MNAELKRHLECDLPALYSIIPDLELAKMGDKSADLDAAIQVISYCVANMRDIERTMPETA